MNLLRDDDSDTEVSFSISKDYAKKYDKWRQGEELERLKNKYGKDLDVDSSTSEEEDEDAVELTKDVEKQFLKTLSALKERNPKIYDSNVRFFEKKPDDEGESANKNKKEKNVPLTVAAYTRKQLLEEGGISNEEEKPLEEMTNVEQERALKESFKDVLKDDDDDDDDEGWGGMFQKRTKTEEELQKEEDDYREWLAGQKEAIENEEVKNDLKGLHDYWTDPKLDEKEAFLKDYILNKRYLEKDKDSVPSYEEVVGDSGESSEEFDKEQQQFEHKYNFRFEEPDQEFIKRYPRIMEQSLRKKDDRRKKHREEVKARKDAELTRKKEELKRLKTLKKMEIMDRIKQLQEITGNEDMPFDTHDLEEDFDPEEHDRRMSQLFSDEYYNVGGEDEKPECPVLNEDLEIENWDEWDGTEGNSQEHANQGELHCEDPGFVMDCDYDPNKNKKLQEEIIESTRSRRKQRRKSRFASVLAKPKPLFDPKDKTFEKYVDEYYSLDYEDLIGDIPCRFKYRKVVPNDFGLTVEEILAAPERELNAWASLKKIVKRRPDHTELNEVKIYQNKASNLDLKKKILPTVFAPNPEEETEPTSNKKKKKRKLTEDDREETTQDQTVLENPEQREPTPDKKKKKRKIAREETKPDHVALENPPNETKKKKKIHRKNENESNNDAQNDSSLISHQNEKEKISEKKKQKFPETEPELESNDNKKEKKKRKAEEVVQNNEEPLKKKKKKDLIDVQTSLKNNSANKKEKNKNKNKIRNDSKNNAKNSDFKISDERLRAYGINPKKFKNNSRNFNKR